MTTTYEMIFGQTFEEVQIDNKLNIINKIQSIPSYIAQAHVGKNFECLTEEEEDILSNELQ